MVEVALQLNLSCDVLLHLQLFYLFLRHFFYYADEAQLLFLSHIHLSKRSFPELIHQLEVLYSNLPQFFTFAPPNEKIICRRLSLQLGKWSHCLLFYFQETRRAKFLLLELHRAYWSLTLFRQHNFILNLTSKTCLSLMKSTQSGFALLRWKKDLRPLHLLELFKTLSFPKRRAIFSLLQEIKSLGFGQITRSTQIPPIFLLIF